VSSFTKFKVYLLGETTSLSCEAFLKSCVPEHSAFWHQATKVFKHLLNLKHGSSHVEFAGIHDMVYRPQDAQ